MRLRPLTLLLAAVAALSAVALAPVAADTSTTSPATAPKVVCTFDSTVLSELSGMAPSIRFRGVFWVHNDSSGGPVIYAINGTTCAIVATVTLASVPGRDIESIASGRDADGVPVLWVGDIGDNKDSWEYVRLYELPEPTQLVDQTLDVRTWRFTYPDGPHDAEALLADPRRPRLWVVTKELAAGVIFELPALPPISLGDVWREPLVLKPVGDTDGLISDGAVSSDGSRFVLRDYLSATIYSGLPPGTKVTTVELPIQPQGEAIAWTKGGTSLLTAGEKEGTLWSVPLPQEAWTKSAQKARNPDPNAADQSEGSGLSKTMLVALLLLAGLVVVLMLRVRAARRREQMRRRRPYR